MKSPTEPFHYEDVKWRKIKQSLAVIGGVDADTTTVPHINDDGEKTRCSLQTKLERLAQKYCIDASRRIVTVRQVIDETTNNIKKIAAARDVFAIASSWVPYLLGDDDEIGEERAAKIHQLLTTVVIDLQETVKQVGSGSEEGVFRYDGKRGNAGKPALRGYLLRLAKVWDELAGASGEPRYRNRFVHACAEPIVADVTGKKVTIKNVRDYLSKKTKTKIF
jgi:hypothetical protein